MLIKNIVIGIIAFVILITLWPKPQANWQGTLAAKDPRQTADNLPSSWTKGKFTYTAKARYDITAVVLSKRNYWAGYEQDEISPYDLALGWGPMSDSKNINALKISQDGRWYNYTWNTPPPIDQTTIAQHSANNHIIPADNRVLDKIKTIHRHDLIHLKGYLVDVTLPNGWYWHTSTTRDDVASGSCEVFWVTDVL